MNRKVVSKGFRFWRKHQIGKRIMGLHPDTTEESAIRVRDPKHLTIQLLAGFIRHAMTASPFAALATEALTLQIATAVVGVAGLWWSARRKVIREVE